jgi:hypothetical protein
MLESLRWVAERAMIKALSGLHAVSRGPFNHEKKGTIKKKSFRERESANKFADTEAVTSPCMSKLLREA